MVTSLRRGSGVAEAAGDQRTSDPRAGRAAATPATAAGAAPRLGCAAWRQWIGRASALLLSACRRLQVRRTGRAGRRAQ